MTEIGFHCRGCGSAQTSTVMSYGDMPLANALIPAEALDEEEQKWPLDLAICHDCFLLQILQSLSPELLFRTYLYFSSFSDTMLAHAERLVRHVLESALLPDDGLVVEIASNDGYLLQYYKEAGKRVLGVEPALNIAATANQKGISTIAEFFDARLAKTIREEHGPASVVHAHNVLAHVADPCSFIGAMATLMEGGCGIIEVPYVRNLIENREFDTVYHEHLSYFSLASLQQIVTRAGLHITDVETMAIHGGSLRIEIRASDELIRPSVGKLLQQEQSWGGDRISTYLELEDRAETVRKRLRELVSGLKGRGHSVAAYGASAKGSTLLNYCGIGRESIDFVADRSRHKQGLYTPGTKIPVLPPETLLAERPDYVLLLAWNFADEILAQQLEYRELGGRFIIPVPDPQIV